MLVRQDTSSRLSKRLLEEVDTPAFVYDELKLETLLNYGLAAREKAGVKLLYAVKALALYDVLKLFESELDGFAVSSLFEARFIKDHFPNSPIHFTSPGIRRDEALELSALSDFVSFNSQSQVLRYGLAFGGCSSIGLRVNTGLSYVADQRYNPCRPSSKLGIPINQVFALLSSAPVPIDGLHIHTNSDSTDYGELLSNVHALTGVIPNRHQLKWVNLGGGYLLEEVPLAPLTEASRILQEKLGVEVFIEPGAGLVRAAGYLVGTVLDIFDVDGSEVVVLDTTVNHMPEVLEFDYQPDAVGQQEDGSFDYILAGTTCLAGDVFGKYRFPEPLEVGRKVVFEEAGAYALTKAHRFNGVNLPHVGILNHDGRYRAAKSFDYQDFVSYWKTND